jgi:hypothetical protein
LPGWTTLEFVAKAFELLSDYGNGVIKAVVEMV